MHPMKHQRPTLQQGFTLLELMIVVAIVGILSAIAYPSYAEYIRKGHRADARAGLLQAQQWLERASTATGVYPTALPNTLQWRDSGGTPDPTKRYTIRIEGPPSPPIGIGGPASPSAFGLRAIPNNPGPQATDRCGDLMVSNTGIRGSKGKWAGEAGYDPDCWNK